MRPFPRGFGNTDVDEFELGYLDSTAGGCLDTFFQLSRLDDERIQILENCLHDLDQVMPHIPTGAVAYFNQLAELCRGVLGALGRRN